MSYEISAVQRSLPLQVSPPLIPPKRFFLRAGRSQRSPSLHAGLLGAETMQVLAIKGALPPL